MTDQAHTDRPEAPKDGDTALDFVTFPIPTLQVLRAVMVAERKAVEEIRHQIAVMATPATALVDPMGKPVPQLGGDIRSRIMKLVADLLDRPILSEAFGLAKTTEGVMDLVQFDPSGLKLAFITYRGLTFVIQQRMGIEQARNLANQVDALLVLSLQALHRQRNPLRVIEKTLKVRGTDPKTGVALIGEPEWAADYRLEITTTLVTFLIASGYVTSDLDPTAGIPKLAIDDFLPFLNLTPAGRRLFLHLRDQMALKASLMTRGSELTAEPETLTQAQVTQDMERALRDPNANLPQA